MARNTRTRTHLENLAIISKSAHGDSANDKVLQVFALDADDISGSPFPKAYITESGRIYGAASALDDDFYGVDTTDLVGRSTGFRGLAPGTADTVTIAVTASVPGTAKLLSGTSDNDAVFLLTEASFYGKFNPSFEARVTIDSASAVALVVGFADATGVGSNLTPVSLATATWTTTAVDGAMFCYDTDATTKTIRLMGVKNNTDATNVDTTLVPVAATYNIYRVELVDNGTTTDAKFYIDGVLVGTILDVLTRTVAMTPFISVGTRTGAAPKYALVDYVKAYQNRA